MAQIEKMRDKEQMPPGSGAAQSCPRASRNGHSRAARAAASGLLALTALLGLFVALVNLSVPFARACRRVPAAEDLAEAVMFSRSMRAAEADDAIQVVDSVQIKNGITLRVHYLTAAKNRLTIFYSVDGSQQAGWTVKTEILGKDGKTTIPVTVVPSSDGVEGIGPGLHSIGLDFGKTGMPGSLTLICTVLNGTEAQSQAQENNYARFEFPLEIELKSAQR